MLKELGKVFLHQLKIILQCKYLLFVIFFIVIAFSLMRINLNVKSKYSGIEKEFKLIVVESGNNQKSTDIVVSASPEFLLKPVSKKYGFKLIATKVDKHTGKLLSKN